MVRKFRHLYKTECFSGLVIALMLLTFFIAAKRLISTPPQNAPTTFQAPASPQTVQETPPASQPKLIFLVQEGKNRYIEHRYQTTANRDSIGRAFTTDRPIIYVMGLAADNTIYALVGNPGDFSGSVISINQQGDINTLVESFAYSAPPILSSKELKFLYVYFSNVEQDIGFHLNEYNLDTHKTKTLATNQEGLSQPSYCLVDMICYVRLNNKNYELISQTPDGQSSRVILSSARPITALSSTKQMIGFIDATTDNQGSRVIIIENNSPKVVSQSQDRAYQLKLSPDDSYVAELLVEKPTAASGKLAIIRQSDNKIIDISPSASFIVGWQID